ncbi:MAG: hypothetical protein NZ602_02715 [Thermoguttaceae bacterium]|nr:hypothetical protein [Thermoguttaceae bacterium]
MAKVELNTFERFLAAALWRRLPAGVTWGGRFDGLKRHLCSPNPLTSTFANFRDARLPLDGLIL